MKEIAMTERKVRVLLIEDDRDDAEIIRLYLAEPDEMGMKFEVERADRLAQGLRLLKARAFDIILLDLILSDNYGIDTAARALAGARGIPLLVMTGFDDESAALDATRLGAQDYLVKSSLDSGLLKSAIRRILERSRLQTVW